MVGVVAVRAGVAERSQTLIGGQVVGAVIALPRPSFSAGS